VANGDRRSGKELIEVFSGGLSASIDDFHTLQIFGNGQKTTQRARLRADKGHRAEWEAFAKQITGNGPVAMPFEDAVASTRTTLAAQRSMMTGEAVNLADETKRASSAAK
jgi:predicted dehydrogenase